MLFSYRLIHSQRQRHEILVQGEGQRRGSKVVEVECVVP